MKAMIEAFRLTAESFIWIVVFVIVIFFDREGED